MLLSYLLSDDSWRRRERDSLVKTDDWTNTSTRSSMQRNIEHEHFPKNTERCRVVVEAASLSHPETSQLLPRRNPVKRFQRQAGPQRGLGVSQATCFRVPDLESVDQESRQANGGHLVSAIRRAFRSDDGQVSSFSPFPCLVGIQSHFSPSPTCVGENTLVWPPHMPQGRLRFSEADSHLSPATRTPLADRNNQSM